MRNVIGVGLVMLGVMMADSDKLIVPAAVIALGLFLLRRAICTTK